MREIWVELSKTHMSIWEEEKEKMNCFQLERQVNILEIEKIQLVLLVKSTLSFRAPSPCYKMFLQEKFIVFQRKSIMTNKPFEITIPTTFLEAYYACTTKDKNLCYDLYQHNYMLFHDPICNPNHFVGYVQLRVFVSSLNKHVDWTSIHKIVQHNFASNLC